MWYLESWLTSPLPYFNFKYSKMTYRHAWLFIHYFIRLRELHLFRTFSENSRYIIAFKVQRSDKNCCEFKNICCPRISISPLPRWVLLMIIAERMLIIISLNESEELHGQNSSKIDISSLFIVKKKITLREETKQDGGLSQIHAESSKSGVHILLLSLISISMFKRHANSLY